MAIVDELKKLIKARNGSSAGVENIEDAVRVLRKLEEVADETTDDEQEETPVSPDPS